MTRREKSRVHRIPEGPMEALERYLSVLVRQKGSDLHLVARHPPLVRVHGELTAISKEALSSDLCQTLVGAAMTLDQQAEFLSQLELDFVYESKALSARFRVNAFHETHGWGAVFRRIPSVLPSLETLGLPDIVDQIADLRSGLVVVSGPTGSGKSTTLAAIVDHINAARTARILSIEDPIEFLHTNKRSLIAQREVRRHTRSFEAALRMVARQDPDVVVIGEVRDVETCRLTLAAAELGTLVLATLHARSASKVVDRVVDVFPADEQSQARAMLADGLRAVIAQQLVQTSDKQGRTLACEILLGSSGISTLIREGKTSMIHSAIQTGTSTGMQTMDGALLELWKSGRISLEVARDLIVDKELFTRAGLAALGQAAPVPAPSPKSRLR